jgi:hypothetical protein
MRIQGVLPVAGEEIFVDSGLTAGAGGLHCAVLKIMKAVIANLNCTPKRAALPICAAWRHDIVIKMTPAMRS